MSSEHFDIAMLCQSWQYYDILGELVFDLGLDAEFWLSGYILFCTSSIFQYLKVSLSEVNYNRKNIGGNEI